MTSAAAPTVLLVDDDELYLEAVAAYLSGCNPAWRVLTAADGLLALAALESEVVDLVVTDLAMPGADGHELVSFLSAHRPDLPVLIVSASPSATWPGGCAGAACADIYAKPVDLWALQTRAAELVEGRGRCAEAILGDLYG